MYLRPHQLFTHYNHEYLDSWEIFHFPIQKLTFHHEHLNFPFYLFLLIMLIDFHMMSFWIFPSLIISFTLAKYYFWFIIFLILANIIKNFLATWFCYLNPLYELYPVIYYMIIIKQLILNSSSIAKHFNMILAILILYFFFSNICLLYSIVINFFLILIIII